MRKLFIPLILIFCLLSVTAGAAELKIGLFSLNSVATSCDAYKAKQADMKKTFESEGKAVEKQGLDLQKLVNEFQIQQQALSPQAREDRQEALKRQSREFEDKRNDFLRRYSNAEKRAQEEIISIVLYSASEYGKREKFSFVLEMDRAGVLWVEQPLDITKAVLEETNKTWKTKPKDLFDQLGK
jgi:outer membrane protein